MTDIHPGLTLYKRSQLGSEYKIPKVNKKDKTDSNNSNSDRTDKIDETDKTDSNNINCSDNISCNKSDANNMYITPAMNQITVDINTGKIYKIITRENFLNLIGLIVLVPMLLIIKALPHYPITVIGNTVYSRVITSTLMLLNIKHKSCLSQKAIPYYKTKNGMIAFGGDDNINNLPNIQFVHNEKKKGK